MALSSGAGGLSNPAWNRRRRALRGGDGTHRRTRFLEEMELAVLGGHRVVAPPGLEAGGAGQTGRSWVVRADGRRETLASADRTVVGPGDVYCLDTPTGGGFTPGES
ncbi:MAG: hydantoinase B/oxoprolinase family protein [Pseudomonadota bacterium]